MNTIALASVRGAPGVTTTALLLASRLGGSALVEADLSGGVLAVRYGLGREPGLTSLAAANPTEDGGWLDHAQDAGGVPVLVGPDSPDAAAALWRTAGERIATVLARSSGCAVIDAGRVWRRTPILDAADVVAVLVRPVAEHVVALSHAVAALRRSTRGQVSVILVGTGPYRSEDVSDALDCTVLAHLPEDPATADHLVDGRISRTRLARSRLARGVAALGDRLEPQLGERQAVPAR